MKHFMALILVSALAFNISGCSSVMALKQPSKKNMQVLNHGVARENVIAYLGAPSTSDVKGDERVDIYNFKQGYSGGWKASRAVFHLVMDVFTLFIWEIIGMPAEAIFDGNEMSVKVVFDENDKVKDFMYLKKE